MNSFYERLQGGKNDKEDSLYATTVRGPGPARHDQPGALLLLRLRGHAAASIRWAGLPGFSHSRGYPGPDGPAATGHRPLGPGRSHIGPHHLLGHRGRVGADPARAATDTEALKASVADSTNKLAGTVTQAGDKLQELGLDSKQERYDTESAKVLAALDSVKAAADSVSPDNPASYGLLSQTIDQAFASPEPAILSSDLSHLAEDDTPIPPVYGASIAPAYLAGAPGLTPSTLPVEPGDDDLAETMDAPKTEEITTLASQLGNDPVAIYEWVHNNIDFECYFGSRKGAASTLAELAGNSTDTANLLLALLRASGIPARYVTGVIELTAAQACSWLATDNISDAQSLLASAGIPTTGIIEGGALSKLELTQTWTEAYVNYGNYRGNDAGQGPRDWIPLDASYKTYELYTPDVDIISALGASYESLSEEYLSSVRQETFVEFLKKKTIDYINNFNPDLSPNDLERSCHIVSSELGVLPPVLPYALVSAESEERELPDSCRWRVSLDLAGTRLEAYFIDLLNNTIEVNFFPASDGDETLLLSYDNADQVPAYLLDLKAEIRAGDNVVETSSSSMGSSASWGLTLTCPARFYNINNSLVWGAPFSVALTPPAGSSGGTVEGKISSGSLLDLFSPCAMTYISMCKEDDKEISSIFGLSLTSGAQEAAVGISLKPLQVAGVTTAIDSQGCYIDADLSTSTPAGKTSAFRRGFVLAAGLEESFREQYVLEKHFGSESVSTAKLIAFANQISIPVVDIDKNSLADLSALSLPQNVKEQMKQSILAGYVINTPTQQLDYLGWVGEGWMVLDPVTGEGAYLITGELSGGCTVDADIAIEYLIITYLERYIEWTYVKEISAYSIEGRLEPAEEGYKVLMDAEYHAHIVEADSPKIEVDGVVDGTFILGDCIVVTRDVEVKYRNTNTVKNLEMTEVLDTSLSSYKTAGHYEYVLNYSGISKDNNVYYNHSEWDPRLVLNLLPLIADGNRFDFENKSWPSEKVLSVVIINCKGTDITSWFDSEGGVHAFNPDFKQEEVSDDDPQVSLDEKKTQIDKHTFYVCLVGEYPDTLLFSAGEDKKCISLEYIEALNPAYSTYQDYQYREFLLYTGYIDLVFDEGQKLDLNQVVYSANELDGIKFNPDFGTEDITQLYDVFIDENGIPCTGVPAYCYDKSGVDIRSIMRNYVLAGCFPELDRGWRCLWRIHLVRWDASDPMLTLRSWNWERYFYHCRFLVQKYIDQGSRGIFKINALDYKSFHAQVGDVIVVYHDGPDYNPNHSAIVTKVEDGVITQVMGASDSMKKVRTYNEISVGGQNICEFFNLEKAYQVSIVGYPAECTR